MAGSTCARLCPVARPVLRPSQMVCNLVVGPRPMTALARGGGLPGSRGAPLRAPAAVLVGPDHAGVDLGVPVQLPSTVSLVRNAALIGPRSYRSASAQTACRPSPKTHSAGQVPPCAPVRTRNRMPFNTWRDPANAIPSGCQSLPAKAPAAPTPRRCRIVASRPASAASPASDPNSPAIRETPPIRTVVSGPWLQ